MEGTNNTIKPADKKAPVMLIARIALAVAAALLVAAFFLALNLVRVAISAATVSVLQANADLATQISEAETLSSNLRIERSVLSSNARISRIATQNYGMVLPSERVTVVFDDPAAEEAAADAHGDAAQSGQQTGEQANVG